MLSLSVRQNTALAIAVLSLCGLLVNCQVFLAIPLISAIAQEFEVSELAAAWLGSAYSFAYALGFLVCGAISDRYGRKQVMVLGLLTFAPITLMVGFSP